MPGWPPPYQIKRHPRAKHARLRIKSGSNLEVLLPNGVPDWFAADLVHERRQWIEKHLRAPRPDSVPKLPERLELKAQSLTLEIDYHADHGYAPRRLGNVLRVDQGQALPHLRAWLKHHARDHLQARLEGLADQHGFRFDKLRVGLQRSRWGSCSTRGTVSLNAALLLIDGHLLDHVILHELCHTRHMNHSAAFYELLGRCDPEHRAHSRALRAAWRELPHWLHHG